MGIFSNGPRNKIPLPEFPRDSSRRFRPINIKSRFAAGNPPRQTLLTSLLDEFGGKGAGEVARQAPAEKSRSREAAVVSESSNAGTDKRRGTTILTAGLDKSRLWSLRRPEAGTGGSSDGGRTSRAGISAGDRERLEGTDRKPRKDLDPCLDRTLDSIAVRFEINKVVDSIRDTEEALFKLEEKVKVVEKDLEKVDLELSVTSPTRIPRTILMSRNPPLRKLDRIMSAVEAAEFGERMARKQRLERELQSHRQSIAANEKALENLKPRRDRLERSHKNLGKLFTDCKEKNS